MNNCGHDNDIRPDSIRKRELFDKYVMPHYDFVRKLCERYTASRNDVDDLFNDVLLNLYKYIETYDASRDLKNWLHVVTKRYVFARNRKNFKITGFELDIENVSYEELGYEEMTCSYGKGLYGDDLLAALGLMPEIHRKAFEMQMSGYSLKEIAKILNESGELESKNINTVKTRVFNARKFLREHVDREGNLIKENPK